VTDALLRTDDGREVWVSQLGGTVGDIGMIQIPGQPLVAPGERVSLAVTPRFTAQARPAPDRAPWPVLEVLARFNPGTDERAKSDSSQAARGDQPMDYVRTRNDIDTPLYWASGCVLITYDATGTSHLSGNREFEIMDQVFATWREGAQSCSYLTFELTGQKDMASVGNDGENTIIFRDDRWCRPATADDPERCYNPAAAALTTLFFVNKADSARNGEIVDADIEFNAVNFSVSTNGSSEGGAPCLSDLANTLTHEVGHLMGLDHTCRTSSELQRVNHRGEPVPLCSLGGALDDEIRQSTMYATQECGETHKSTPSPDDITGVCAIYPLDESPDTCGPPGSTTGRACCSVAPGQRTPIDSLPALWPLIALAGAGALRRRRRA
jgi:MYXO-CTERM domain-containing protein